MARKTTKPAAAAGDTAQVRFDTPGIPRIGEYRRGEVYTVPAAEAARLVKVKGFVYVTPPAQPAGSQE